MQNIMKLLASCIIGYLSPIKPLLMVTLVFILVDFITGNVADYKHKKSENKKYAFESKKARKTITKSVGYLVGISLSFMIESKVLQWTDLNITRIFAASCCLVEFWSWLENIAYISNNNFFLWLRSFTKQQIKDKTGVDINIDENDNNKGTTNNVDAKNIDTKCK